MASQPAEILSAAFQRASTNPTGRIVDDSAIISRVELVCRNLTNRAPARFLLACLLAKGDKPTLDIRKPYTAIGGAESYSGRSYDEDYIGPFITQYDLPCNSTTAFLTPAFRNRNIVLTPDVNMVGRPAHLYENVLQLLTDVHTNRVSAADLLAETIRSLLAIQQENRQRMQSLLANLKSSGDPISLSAEAIVALIEQHLKSPRASRLPVLVVASAYRTTSDYLREQALPLRSHNAADEQTGALGDVEIRLLAHEKIVTAYEMKTRRVTKPDIDLALQKIAQMNSKLDNYIFVTTEIIEQEIKEYATTMYEQYGVEVVVLDCLDFLRYFLHLFHRLRTLFLDTYQALVLSEPDSAVSQPLKEVFLALRQAAESGAAEAITTDSDD
ncbi:MAG: restriction endonuclease, SacI family [Chloroflexota bacterium]|nr:restriction endonuclease, SacI family [Chloroflexota bacterium]